MKDSAKKAVKEIINQQIQLASPSKEDLLYIARKTKELVKILNKNIKNAEVFIGGSSAKGTLIKKDKYDIDVFVRFETREDKNLSELLQSVVPRNAKRVHGSRDYFFLKNERIEFEIIPVLKIKKPEEAKNITDLSYFHVNYVRNKLRKNPKLADEIKLAKVFAHFQDCYGAESYINGFSGYSLELLIIHYKTFLNFIKAIANIKEKKLFIDHEKHFKSIEEIKRELNEEKIQSPIVLIDPTYRERNALAALSYETFFKFQDACRKFLEKPSKRFFEPKDREELMKKRYRKKLIVLKLSTDKQPGDIAGTKLKRFYNFFILEASRLFDIKKHDFVYDEKTNVGKILLVAEQKKEVVFPGPPVKMKDALRKFKQKHKKIKIIKGRAYAYEKSIAFRDFLRNFENNYSRTIEEMGVSGLSLEN